MEVLGKYLLFIIALYVGLFIKYFLGTFWKTSNVNFDVCWYVVVVK